MGPHEKSDVGLRGESVGEWCLLLTPDVSLPQLCFLPSLISSPLQHLEICINSSCHRQVVAWVFFFCFFPSWSWFVDATVPFSALWSSAKLAKGTPENDLLLVYFSVLKKIQTNRSVEEMHSSPAARAMNSLGWSAFRYIYLVQRFFGFHNPWICTTRIKSNPLDGRRGDQDAGSKHQLTHGLVVFGDTTQLGTQVTSVEQEMLPSLQVQPGTEAQG